MKLLLCLNCGDIFSLNNKEKKCSCGDVKGKYYEDGLFAEYYGNAIPIGFVNNSFMDAIKNQPKEGNGTEFTAFIIPQNCNTFKHTL